MYSDKNLKERAFSTLELLMATSILVLLMALFMPVFKGIKESSKSSVCMSNLRQISIALQSYSLDHGGFLPSLSTWDYVNYPSPTGEQYRTNTWIYNMWSYFNLGPYRRSVNDVYRNATTSGPPNIFICPTTLVCRKNVPTLTSPPQSYGGICYGMNADPMVGTNGVNWLSFPFHRSRIHSSETTSLLLENGNQYGSSYTFFTQTGLMPHGGGLNVVFFDGHIEKVGFNEIPVNRSSPFWSGK